MSSEINTEEGMSSSSSPGSQVKKRVISVGSRASSLALIQTKFVVSCLQDVYPEYDFNIHTMKTLGDKILEKPLPDIGDKGLFTQELEEALLTNQVDFIVHSLKDLPTALPDDCCIGAVLKREDPCDVIVLKKGMEANSALDIIQGNLSETKTVRIGTSSLRRQSQLQRINPSVVIKDVRGNLTTRLEKLDGLRDGVEYDALILACSGLKRAGYGDRISFTLGSDDDNDNSTVSSWMYAVGQGALAVECRLQDDFIHSLLKPLSDQTSMYEIIAERSLLSHLEGGCSVPIGVKSSWTSFSDLSLTAAVFSLDGTVKIEGKKCVKLNRSHAPLLDSDEEKEVAQLRKKRRLSVEQLTDAKDKLLNGLLVPRDCPVLHSNYESCFQMGLELAKELTLKGADALLKEIKETKERRKEERQRENAGKRDSSDSNEK